MDYQLEQLLDAMADAACSRDAIDVAARLYQKGSTEELTRHLRRCRCDLLDDLHERQRRLDRLDFLIRQTRTHATR